MIRISLAATLVSLVAFGALSLRAADEPKTTGLLGPFRPIAIATMAKLLGDELKLTDDQKTKVEAANAEFAKRMDEVFEKPEVKPIIEQMIKERKTNKIARGLLTKLNKAMGFDPKEEYAKTLMEKGTLSEQQIAKLGLPRVK